MAINFFGGKQTAQTVSPRQVLESRYSAARANLLLVVAFTLVNTVLTLVGSDLYFLFSATIPYYLVLQGMFLCGKMPAEIYEDMMFEFFDPSLLVILSVIAAVILLLYFLAWLFSGKHRVGWMIFALVLFVLDTASLLLIYGLSPNMILDILFHAWVLYYLVAGVMAHFKLKKLPQEDPAEAVAEGGAEAQSSTEFDESLFVISSDDENKDDADKTE